MIFHQKTAVTGSFCFCMLKVFPQGLLLVCRFDKEERELQSLEEQQRAKTAAALKQVELKLELERARLIEKMNNELAMARRKVEEKKARSAIDTKIMRRPAKSPRGCLFLG